MLSNVWAIGVAIVFFGGTIAGICAAEPEDAAMSPIATATNSATNDQQLLRWQLQLQDQLHSTIQELKQSRAEAEAMEKRSAEMFGARLQVLELALANQRNQEIERLQSTQRTLLWMAGIIGGITIAFMLLMGWLQYRTTERFTELASAMPAVKLLGSGMPESALLPKPDNGMLLGAIARLEKRVQELAQTTPEAEVQVESNGKGNGVAAAKLEVAESARQREALVAQSETFLQLDLPQKALECLDQALRTEPGNADLLIKRATALNQLKRHEEALACLDEAIASDSSITLPYLRKAAVLNQLGRFDEAVACYDQALNQKEKARQSKG